MAAASSRSHLAPARNARTPPRGNVLAVARSCLPVTGPVRLAEILRVRILRNRRSSLPNYQARGFILLLADTSGSRTAPGRGGAHACPRPPHPLRGDGAWAPELMRTFYGRA